MPVFQDIALAAATGFLSGLILSIPVGPINLTIMNEGARRGFFWAFMIGLGATAMEVIYCFIAFTGFSSFFSSFFSSVGASSPSPPMNPILSPTFTVPPSST